MKALWIFFTMVMFCLYILIGLYITDGIESFVQIALTWLIYTILCTTFLNVFALGYFWSVIRNKKGPTGLRGQPGERGKIGLKGVCSMDTTEAYLMKALTQNIDNLYFAKTNTHIMDETTYMIPNNYISNKISTMAGSRQYKVIYANLSKSGRPLINVINYLNEIMTVWFNLIYEATAIKGEWFKDEYADEDYDWLGTNPFIEIKKYDIYYWGITRDFRPLKAEICRTTSTYESSKVPLPNNEMQPRLKIVESNDYIPIANDAGSGIETDATIFRPKMHTVGEDTYYPVGDIIRENYGFYKNAPTLLGNDDTTGFIEYPGNNLGPAMRTVLVSGDITDPVSYTRLRTFKGWGKISLHHVNCPDGYTSIGDVAGRWESPNVDNNAQFIYGSTPKCVPTECVEQINKSPGLIWFGSNNVALNKEANGTLNADPENGYNLFRYGGYRPFYKIKASCLKPPVKAKAITKDIEPEVEDLGIGWYGHPYKLESKYSIFTFLGLVPEGIIVNDATGRRLYVVHYGGEEANIYIVLAHDDNGEYINAIQVDSDTNKNTTKIRKISRMDVRQQWKIKFPKSDDKTYLELESDSNKKYLYIGLDPFKGNAIYSTINSTEVLKNIDKPFENLTLENIQSATKFTFISSVGTNLNIVDGK